MECERTGTGTMKITREKPCQRRHHRVSTPLELQIDGGIYNAADWSLGGFRLGGWDRKDCCNGTLIGCYFKLPFQGFDIAFEVNARIVRVDIESCQMAAQFDDLSERQIELMSHFIEDLVRGAMSPVEDTILRIDSPVTPVSTKPDPSPADEVPIKRWPTKLIVMSSLYVTVGLALFLYIFFILYSNFFSLEVESGVVAAPIERIISTTDGRITEVSVELDHLVRQGDDLMVLEDASIEEQISLAQIDIERSRALLAAKREELALEQEKLNDYRNFAYNKLEEAKAYHASMVKQSALADKNLSRYSQLYKKKLIAKKTFDETLSKQIRLAGELALAVIELKTRRDAIASLKHGRYFTGERLEGQSKEIKAEVERLMQEVTLSTQTVVALYERRDRLNIKAPSRGRVIEMVKSAGSSTKRGETIALFERDEQRVIEVYLTQDEVISVKLAHPARVYFPSLDISVNSVVAAIDRTEGFLHEKESRYSWRASEDRTAKVTLKFVGLSTLNIRAKFTPGLPAIVVFPNLSAGTLGDLLRSFRSQTRAQYDTEAETQHSLSEKELILRSETTPEGAPNGLSF